MDYIDNDYELVYRVCENDDDALKSLLDKYDNTIKSCAYYYQKMYKKYNISKEELIQEGKIAVYSATNNYKVKKDVKFSTFVLVCIKRAMQNYILTFTRQKNLTNVNTISYEECDFMLSNDDDPYFFISNYEFQQFIVDFKNTLNFLDANIFELRYNSFSYQDIATLLAINKKKVDNSLTRTKEKLKKYMLENNFVLYS